MEPPKKDQPKPFLTRLLLVSFGPFDRKFLRDQAVMSKAETTGLVMAMVVTSVLFPVLARDGHLGTLLSSAIYLVFIGLYVLAAYWVGSRESSPDSSGAYFNGAVMMMACFAPVAMVIAEMLPLGAREFMAVFAAAWIGLRLVLLRPEPSHPSEIE